MRYTRKDLLDLASLSAEEITLFLDTAERFKAVSEREVKKVPTLRGYTIVNLFFENSTRTRISFELAEKRLSADIVNFSASTSSVSKGRFRDRNPPPSTSPIAGGRRRRILPKWISSTPGRRT